MNSRQIIPLREVNGGLEALLAAALSFVERGIISAPSVLNRLSQDSRCGIECRGQELRLHCIEVPGKTSIRHDPINHQFMEVDDMTWHRVLRVWINPDQRPALVRPKYQRNTHRGAPLATFVIGVSHGGLDE